MISKRGKCFGLCKLENGKPVGYVVAKRTIDAYHLLTIAVDIEHRGKGYGSLLIDSIFTEIEKKGGESLMSLPMQKLTKAYVSTSRTVLF